jgi:hypothetical protein
MTSTLAPVRRSGLFAVAVAVAVSACGGGSARSGAPTATTVPSPPVSTTVPSPPVSVTYPTSFPITGDLVTAVHPVVLAGVLGGAAGGYMALYPTVALGTKPVMCGGRNQGGRTVAADGDAGLIGVGLRGTGLLVLSVQHLRASFDDTGSVTCLDQSGTYVGGDRLDGTAGTFGWSAGRLTLRPTVASGAPPPPSFGIPSVTSPTGTTTGFPPGFPTSFASTGGGLTSFQPGPQGNVIALVTRYRASDGTDATAAAVAQERRVAGGSVVCGGKPYHGPYTEDVTNAGPTFLGIRGWGYALLISAHTVGAYRDSDHSMPICVQDAGTYSLALTKGLGGKVKTGNYTKAADGSLTLT